MKLWRYCPKCCSLQSKNNKLCYCKKCNLALSEILIDVQNKTVIV